jgi:hypothetical protein
MRSARRARASGIPVLCYTVNDPRLAAALFARGVAAVFSDRIDCLGDGTEVLWCLLPLLRQQGDRAVAHPTFTLKSQLLERAPERDG